ncbi:hypothetical protein M8J75_012766 [Diaphorina citri]|nr:hypothetical protein M8J75_012766 [Diaphorina citri]
MPPRTISLGLICLRRALKNQDQSEVEDKRIKYLCCYKEKPRQNWTDKSHPPNRDWQMPPRTISLGLFSFGLESSVFCVRRSLKNQARSLVVLKIPEKSSVKCCFKDFLD